MVYLCITVTHLRGRARLMRERPEALTVRMWAYPWLSLLVLAALLAIIAGMAADSGSRRSLLLTLLVTAVAVVAGLITQRVRHPKNATEPAPSRTLV